MKDQKNKIALVGFFWIILIVLNIFLNASQVKQSHLQENLRAARSFIDLIVTTRQWNSELNGVYAPITDEIQPNIYLNVQDRDITTTNGLELTKINPAYMTRLIAELSAKNESVFFNITSLKPLRPENAPSKWEENALLLFETDDLTEYYEINSETNMFKYIYPVKVKESCLSCHEKQGYKTGDIRGGISVVFDYQKAPINSIIISNMVIGITGLFFILGFGNKLNSTFIELQQKTIIDSLTKINNRYFFDTYFKQEFKRSKRVKSSLALLFCDIDNFKNFNDRYGHQAGDVCLNQVSQHLKKLAKRPGDFVARYGGEEFVVVLPETDFKGAYKIAEELRKKIESLKIPNQGSSTGKFVTISVGGAIFNGEDSSLESLLYNADQAMYQAKHSGRNKTVFHDKNP